MTIAGRYTEELRSTTDLLHEIRLTQGPDPRPFRNGLAILISCTCLLYHGPGPGHTRRDIIEARTLFPAADAIAAWRAWHKARGMVLP